MGWDEWGVRVCRDGGDGKWVLDSRLVDGSMDEFHEGLRAFTC